MIASTHEARGPEVVKHYGGLAGSISEVNGNGNTSSSDFPCPADDPRDIPEISGCRFVNDGGPFIKYAGKWALSSADGDGRRGSIHQATSPNASVEISFDGTGLALFGIVPPSNQTDPPPAASYTVDNNTSSHRTLPFADECQRNQDFFDVYHLPEGNHTVAITVTAASSSAPYILDFILLCRPASAGPQVSTTGQNAQSSGHTAGGIIVGATVGAVSLVLGLAFLAFLRIHSRRRKRTRDPPLDVHESCAASTDNVSPPLSPTGSQDSPPSSGGDETTIVMAASSPSPGLGHVPLRDGRCSPDSVDTDSPPPAYSLV